MVLLWDGLKFFRGKRCVGVGEVDLRLGLEFELGADDFWLDQAGLWLWSGILELDESGTGFLLGFLGFLLLVDTGVNWLERGGLGFLGLLLRLLRKGLAINCADMG